MWGDKDEAVDKTGVAIDGPDGDSDVSFYQPDTAIAAQDIVAGGAHASGSTFSRATTCSAIPSGFTTSRRRGSSLDQGLRSRASFSFLLATACVLSAFCVACARAR